MTAKDWLELTPEPAGEGHERPPDAPPELGTFDRYQLIRRLASDAKVVRSGRDVCLHLRFERRSTPRKAGP